MNLKDRIKTSMPLFLLLAGAMAALAIYILISSRNVAFEINDGTLEVSVINGNHKETIHPYYYDVEDTWYIFLPSFVKNNKIYNTNSDNEIYINGSLLKKNQVFIWEDSGVYDVTIGGNTVKYRFMKSANIPSMFLTTKSGSMELINSSKENYETGTIAVFMADGSAGYAGNYESLAGRGGSTFSDAPVKKSYKLDLKEKKSLCGLSKGKKWNLLGMYFENNKVRTKILFETAKAMGLDYTPECQWIDLYCNGEYMGMYMLTNRISISDNSVNIHNLQKNNISVNGRNVVESLPRIVSDTKAFYDILDPQDISGGYLIEKGTLERMEDDEAYFITDNCGYVFSVSSPATPSKSEVDYIKDYMQQVEDSILREDGSYKNYIDVDSFAARSLIDKILMEQDAGWDSTFFYKDAGDGLLYSGPVWDFDRSIGACQMVINYNTSLNGSPNWMYEWYEPLYNDSEFEAVVLQKFGIAVDFYRNLLYNGKLDEYVEEIDASRKMDQIICDSRYYSPTWTYKEYDNQIRFVKYFIANRMNYLMDQWGLAVTYGYFSVQESNGEYHTVRFIDQNGNIIRTEEVLDGDTLICPEYDTSIYEGWKMYGLGNCYSDTIPIYEDMDLFLWEEDTNK